MKTLPHFAALAALAAGTALTATPAAAQAIGNPDGKIQVKLLATAVLADGSIKSVKNDPLGLTTGANTTANNNVVPTVAIEYFLKPNISVETICCFTQHHVNGTGALAGANLINHVLILPATITAKYHFVGLLPFGIKPYVGAGPAVFFNFDTNPGSTAQALGVTRVHMSDNFGGAVQMGFDVPIGHHGLGLSVDAKKYWVATNAHFYAGNTEVLATTNHLDPWVISTGVAFRF